jgi:hypothetical protein
MPESLKSVEVRGKLVDALRLDLAGPSDGLGDPEEVLPKAPSRTAVVMKPCGAALQPLTQSGPG